MDEAIKKIDEEIEFYKAYDDLHDKGVRKGLKKAKDIVLSEQKEEKLQKIKFHQEHLKELLKDEPQTIGDKIRESNESLAEFVQNLIHCEDCTMNLVDGKPLCNGGTAISCEYRILDYLNRPIQSPSDNP